MNLHQRDVPHWAEDLALELVNSIRAVPVKTVIVRGRIRVDQPHPRRREKAGDYIDMADLRVTMAARAIWAGWTPGITVEVQFVDGTVVQSPWIERLVCCDMHNTHCEPPSELCCALCSEVFHPKHSFMPCVLTTTPAETAAHPGGGTTPEPSSDR